MTDSILADMPAKGEVSQTQSPAFRVFFNSSWPEIIAAFTCLLAFLRALDVHSQLLGWDIDGSPLDPQLALHRSLSAWAWHVGLGTDNSPAHAQLLLYAFEAALQRLGGTAGGIQWIVYGLVFVSVPIGMGWYTRLLFERQPAARLIANLALAFNFYHAITWYTPLPVYEIGLLGGPLLAAAALSFARRPRAPMTLAFMALAALVTSPAGANAAVAFVMLSSAVVLVLVAFERWPRDRRSFALPALLYGALNAFWLIPTAVFVLTQHSIVLAGEYVKNWGLGTLAATSGAATPSNVIRLIGTWDWTHSDAAGHRYIAYAPWYEHSPALLALSFILPALAFASLWSPNKRQALTIGGALVAALFLMKGTAQPFGAAYLWTFEHFAPFEAFRVPFSKFGILAAPLLALLAGLGADAVIRRVSQRAQIGATAVIFIAVASSIWPYWVGQMFRRNAYMPSYYVRIPGEYEELARYLNTQPNQSSRVLVLPFSPALSYSAFTWGYNGPDLLPYLIRLPTITEADSWADPFTHLAFRDVSRSPGELLSAVQRNAIEYVLVHRDVDTKFYGATDPSTIETLVRNAGGQLIGRLGGRALALYTFGQPRAPLRLLRLNESAVRVAGLSAPQMASLSPLNVYSLSDALGRGSAAVNHRVPRASVALVPLPVSMQVRHDGEEKTNVVPVLPKTSGGFELPAESTGTLAIGQQVIDTETAVSISSGYREIRWLTHFSNHGRRWEVPLRQSGDDSAGVHRTLPLDVLPGSRAYVLDYKANGPALSAGAAIECCSGAHRRVLSPDLALPIDGKRHKVAFFLSQKEPMPARIIIYGNGADAILHDLKVWEADATAPRTLLFPQFALVRFSDSAAMTPNAVPLGEVTPEGVGLSNALNVALLAAPRTNGSFSDARLDRAVVLTPPFAMRLKRQRGGSLALVPEITPTAAGAPIPYTNGKTLNVAIDAQSFHAGDAVLLTDGPHRVVVSKPLQPSHTGIKIDHVIIPRAGQWLVELTYRGVQASQLEARFSYGEGADVRVAGDTSLLGGGGLHRIAFVVDASSRIDGRIDIAGAGARDWSGYSLSLGKILNDQIFNVPSAWVISSADISDGKGAARLLTLPMLNLAPSGGSLLKPAEGVLAVPLGDLMRVQPSEPGLLVASAAFNPGWVARGPHGALPKVIADGTYNAWLVDAANPIDLDYRPRIVWIVSALASAMTLLFTATACGWRASKWRWERAGMTS